MGLEPDVVLRAHLGPGAELIIDLRDVEPDPGQVTGWEVVFTQAWAERVGGSSRARTRERATRRL
jgi:hypothetical protein